LAGRASQAEGPSNDPETELEYNPAFPEKPSTWSFHAGVCRTPFLACPFI
jgi:hypothetical protein